MHTKEAWIHSGKAVSHICHPSVCLTQYKEFQSYKYTNWIIPMTTCQQKAITDWRSYGLVCNPMKIGRLTISKFSFRCSLLKRVLTGAYANGDCWDQHQSPSVHHKTCTRVIQDSLSGTQVASTQDLDCILLSSMKYSLRGSFSKLLVSISLVCIASQFRL